MTAIAFKLRFNTKNSIIAQMNAYIVAKPHARFDRNKTLLKKNFLAFRYANG